MSQFPPGTRSKAELKGVHLDLVAVVQRAITLTIQDFSVHDGIRSLAEQQRLVAGGASQTLDSHHITGHAVDLVLYINGKLRWEWAPICHTADAMRVAAQERGTPLRRGGAWKALHRVDRFPGRPGFGLRRAAPQGRTARVHRQASLRVAAGQLPVSRTIRRTSTQVLGVAPQCAALAATALRRAPGGYGRPCCSSAARCWQRAPHSPRPGLRRTLRLPRSRCSERFPDHRSSPCCRRTRAALRSKARPKHWRMCSLRWRTHADASEPGRGDVGDRVRRAVAGARRRSVTGLHGGWNGPGHGRRADRARPGRHHGR